PIAMWKAPFLNGPRRGVGLRVPSGAITSEVPALSAAIAGRSAAIARWRSKRSMNTVPASAKAGPKSGFRCASYFATPTNAQRGDGGEAAFGVNRAGPADDLEQRQVLVAVGVEVALREVDALRAGELTRRHRLTAAVDRGPEVAPGEPPVLHLEPRAEDVRDTELARDRLDLVAGGRRHDGERVAATPVGLHERARL